MTEPRPRKPIPDYVLHEYCTCMWVHQQNPENPDGPALAQLHSVDPKCPLHGPNAQPAPF